MMDNWNSPVLKINIVINAAIGHHAGDLERLAGFEAKRARADLAAKARGSLNS